MQYVAVCLALTEVIQPKLPRIIWLQSCHPVFLLHRYSATEAARMSSHFGPSWQHSLHRLQAGSKEGLCLAATPWHGEKLQLCN